MSWFRIFVEMVLLGGCFSLLYWSRKNHNRSMANLNNASRLLDEVKTTMANGPSNDDECDTFQAPQWFGMLPPELRARAATGRPILVGTQLWVVCGGCRQLVEANKLMFGTSPCCLPRAN